ncbi:MAG TPA: c-type cytochrome [Burkholderiales bacterium]|nr:c-type cytochrome [Burkholderiales bacterium]
MSLENLIRVPAAAVAALAAAAALAGSAPAMAANAQDFCGAEATPCTRYGAHVFQARCALCHGSDGLGGGVVPLSVPGYPPTNLLQPKHAHDADELRKLVSGGPGVKGVSSFMPPWADELTLTQIESVVQFLVYLRKDTEAARLMLRAEAAAMKPSTSIGRALYQGRCALCHGTEGRANGRMAAIIKDPPPFNLTLSRAPDIYLREIIAKGGGAMGRSQRMPPWGGDLNQQEIESVILFLKTLREGP